MESLTKTINTEKKRLLLTADSLLNKRQYEAAKANLYDALYLDPTNTQILSAINLSNIRLKQDTVSLAMAVQFATSKGDTSTRASRMAITTAPPVEAVTPMIDSTAIKAAAARKRRRIRDSINAANRAYEYPTYTPTTTNGTVLTNPRVGVSETHSLPPAVPAPAPLPSNNEPPPPPTSEPKTDTPTPPN